MGINPAMFGFNAPGYGGFGAQQIPGMQQAAGIPGLGNAMGTGNPGQFAGINLGIGQSTGDVFQSSNNAVGLAQAIANGQNVDPAAMASIPGVSPSMQNFLTGLNGTMSNGFGDPNNRQALLAKLPKSMQQWAAGLMDKSDQSRAKKEQEGEKKDSNAQLAAALEKLAERLG